MDIKNSSLSFFAEFYNEFDNIYKKSVLTKTDDKISKLPTFNICQMLKNAKLWNFFCLVYFERDFEQLELWYKLYNL